MYMFTVIQICRCRHLYIYSREPQVVYILISVIHYAGDDIEIEVKRRDQIQLLPYVLCIFNSM